MKKRKIHKLVERQESGLDINLCGIYTYYGRDNAIDKRQVTCGRCKKLIRDRKM